MKVITRRIYTKTIMKVIEKDIIKAIMLNDFDKYIEMALIKQSIIVV